MPLSGFYSVAQLRQIEWAAKAQGLALMPRAAQAAAEFIAVRFGSAARVLVLAGPGNNGGDALLAATLLQSRGYAVRVCMPQTVGLPADAAAAYQTWCSAGGTTDASLPSEPPTVVIDGLFGIGANRPLGEPWLSLIAAVNAWQRPILALDVPSGIAADTGAMLGVAIQARWTLSFIGRAKGLATAAARDHTGSLHCHTLDLPDHLLPCGEITTTEAESRQQRLPRPHDSHKGQFGSVAILGGASGMQGAPLLAGRAALHAGAGKVWVGFLDAAPMVDLCRPELMLSQADASLIARADTLAIGPGLGQSAAAQALLAAALASDKPLVIDADALNMLSNIVALRQQLSTRRAITILTPHPSEAARWLGCTTAAVQNDRYAAAQQLADTSQAVVILKGAGSLVAHGTRIAVNQTGSAALANAGQGDVLSGVLAGLLAQGLDGWHAANLAVWAHGAASDALRARTGQLVTLADEVGRDVGRVVGRRRSDRLSGDAD